MTSQRPHGFFKSFTPQQLAVAMCTIHSGDRCRSSWECRSYTVLRSRIKTPETPFCRTLVVTGATLVVTRTLVVTGATLVLGRLEAIVWSPRSEGNSSSHFTQRRYQRRSLPVPQILILGQEHLSFQNNPYLSRSARSTQHSVSSRSAMCGHVGTYCLATPYH